MWATGQTNWTKNVYDFVERLGIQCLLDCDCLLSLKEAINMFDMALTEHFEENWKGQVQRESAMRSVGQNKLRTYRQFKLVPHTEHYVNIIMPKKFRSAMARF